jgi:hypothetical protein
LSDSSNGKNKKKTKRKINWSEYNESVVRRGEMLFDTDFFTELASRAKENKQRKGRHKLSLSEFLDIATARHRTRLPSTIPIVRRLSKDDVRTHKETPKDSTGFHNNLGVESSKDEDKPRPQSKP